MSFCDEIQCFWWLILPLASVTCSSYTWKWRQLLVVKLRKDFHITLVGYISNQIVGAKLPSNRQCLSDFYYNVQWEKKPRISDSEELTTVLISYSNSVINGKIYRKIWPLLQARKKMDDLFDIDALGQKKIEEDRKCFSAKKDEIVQWLT